MPLKEIEKSYLPATSATTHITADGKLALIEFASQNPPPHAWVWI